jgi:ribosomal protein S18 acetylase RimI-like enzyme
VTDLYDEMLSVVKLAEEDWPLWRSLRLQALEDAPYAFGSTLEQWSGDNDREDRWRDRLRNSALTLVCLFDEEPAGMVAATPPAKNETELQSMWVKPRFRGRGVGDQLANGVLQWATEYGLAQVRFDIRATNRLALQLYERHGFFDTGERHEKSRGLCEVSMVRILSR